MHYVDLSSLFVKYPVIILNCICWWTFIAVPKGLKMVIVGLLGYHKNVVLIFVEAYRC